ncbi:hypothetical protein L1987_55764 [Smallanthus sonchifolius]|uniref:Uncharacterized protein n=1 Tax=Smallanthus sonchifolius TaxID=185202 RepID=A0ACB9EAH4_9ASTR|nr:hypothetical protein L1987_55764 [Smallanthus sonchifolius]
MPAMWALLAHYASQPSHLPPVPYAGHVGIGPSHMFNGILAKSGQNFPTRAIVTLPLLLQCTPPYKVTSYPSDSNVKNLKTARKGRCKQLRYVFWFTDLKLARKLDAMVVVVVVVVVAAAAFGVAVVKQEIGDGVKKGWVLNKLMARIAVT